MKKMLSAVFITASAFLASCGGDKTSTDSTSSTTVSSDTAGSRMDNGNTTMSNDTMNRNNSDATGSTGTASGTAGGNGTSGSNGTSSAMGTGTPVTAKDVTDFVQKAASGGMMEVQMGQMASQNAQSQRVKDYGAMLVTDHTNAGNELKTMAASNSISVPADMMPENKSHMSMLMNKKGAGCDKAYMDMMIKDHKKDIDAYKKASMGLSDASYKAFAAKTLPVLQKHLDSAQAINKGM